MTDKPRKMRFERKHLIDRKTAFLLKQRLSYALSPDEHSSGGSYRVSSIYFDDMYNTALHDKINGLNDREKLRVRYYNGCEDDVFLESKEKQGELIHKEREKLSRGQYELLLSGSYSFMDTSSPLLKRFRITHLKRHLRPVVMVEYDRHAYKFAAGNVRITFDSGITASKPFSEQRYTVTDDRYTILEIKYDRFLPLFIQDMLGGLTVSQRQAVSKYATARLVMQGR